MREDVFVLLPPGSPPEATSRFPGRRLATADEVRDAAKLAERAVWVAPDAASLTPMIGDLAGLRSSCRCCRQHALLVLQPLSVVQRTVLGELFRHVLAPAEDVRFLPADQFAEIVGAPERTDYFVAIAVDRASGVVLLHRGNLGAVLVPFAWFEAAGGGTVPDFDDFAVGDFGQTVRLGRYEAATSAILYDFDPEYRKRAKERARGLDHSLGGSIRRLRILRGLRQADFPGISAKEIGRIERGLIDRPHPATLTAIAERLGLTVRELGTY